MGEGSGVRSHGGRSHSAAHRRDLLLLALTACALFLGGHPETVLYSLVTVLAVLAASSLPRRRLGQALGALLLAGLAAAPALLPAAAYLPQSLRAARMREGAVAAPAPAASRGEDLARRLLPVAAPNAYGNSRFVDYWGLSNTNEDASGFVGTAALLAALLALRARRRFPLERLALGGALLGLLILAHPPGLGHVLPASLLESRRLLLIVSLAVAFLAACTLERFRLGATDRWTLWALLAAAAFLAVVVVWGTLAHPDPADPGRLAILRFGWVRWQMRFLGVSAVLLGMALFVRRSRAFRPFRAWVSPAVACLIAAELLLLHRPANPPMPRRLAFPVTGPIRFLQDNARRTRVAALGRALPPNLAGLYGLNDVRVYNPMAPRAYLDWIAPITAGWWGEVPELGAPLDPLYQRLSVHYLLTAPDARLPEPLHRVFADETGAVWELPGPFPRLFLLPTEGTLRIQLLEPDHLQARIELPREGALLTSVYQDGGWRLLWDGAVRPTATADGPCVAARLPAGTAEMDLLYRPAAFLWGCLLAALALAAGAAWWTPRPRAY